MKTIDFDKLKVQVLEVGDDLDLANDIMSRQHYLGTKRLAGERLQYLVKEGQTWVALLYFEHATLHTKVRDDLIGWTLKERKERIKFISRNCRFLILKGFEKRRNLGSKILSLIERQISNDWLKRYGHPLLAIETYTDPEQGYEGSCYKGAGWLNPGMSAGYKYKNGKYSEPKQYFIKPLHKDAFLALRGEFNSPIQTGVRPIKGTGNNYVFDPNKIDFPSLRKALSSVPDPRKPGRRRRRDPRYQFTPLLTLCVAATLAGNTQYTQIHDWIANLSKEQRIKAGLRFGDAPSYSRIQTLLSMIDATKLEKAIGGWLEQYSVTLAGKQVYLDGKAQRATSHSASKQNKFLNVLIGGLGIVVKQEPIRNNSEQAAAYQAIAELPLNESLVMLDALHTSAKTADLVVKKTPIFSSLLNAIMDCSNS